MRLALYVSIQHADARAKKDDEQDDEEVGNDGADDGNVVFGEVQLVVIVTASAVDFFGLDNLGREAVGVDDVLRARASLNKLRGNPKLR